MILTLLAITTKSTKRKEGEKKKPINLTTKDLHHL